MSNGNRQQQKKYLLKMSGLLLGFCLTVGVNTGTVHAEGTESAKLQNGSFEEGQDVTTWTRDYQQPNQSSVPSWNTTAKEGKIELFKENTGTYINGVTLKPTEGNIAAELNADEESTLYQNVATTPSSIYTWGLDHGARNATDTMALVIGPKQSVNPSKPDRDGRDQLMQMVDWLIAQGKTSVKNSTNAGLGEQLTVYSKKFDVNGTFQDNAGGNAFSLTPSSVYTEEWKIWIIADSRATSGENTWGKYGTNAVGSGVSTGSSGNPTIDTSKYYLYTVPAGQTETLFGFVSVGCVDAGGSETSNKTFGNFLDNINFQLYHPLSGSTTLHGSGVVGGSDGSSGGAGTAGSGYEVTVGHQLITYAVAGEPLKVQAVVKAADATAGCEFVGLYYTKQNTGNPVTVFLQRAGNEINDTGSLTEAEKRGKWIKSTNSVGDIIYTYYLDNLSSATDLQFVFIKSPTVTYDPNGGLSYQIDRGTYPYNTGEFQNVYSYKPVVDGENYTFIPPYVSHAAEGHDGWRFMGWLLTGDTVSAPAGTELIHAEQLGSLLLPAKHTISCNYSVNAADQHFKIWNGNPALTAMTSGEPNPSVKWVADETAETAETAYANVHKGLTLVAQWRWKQAFIPQLRTNESYTDSKNGGTVEITSVTDTSNPNYEVADETGKKSYYATTNETIKATATAKTGFQFEGWYDKRGNLLTTQSVYSYTETKESVNTFYARFSKIVTQTYKRQIKEEGIWKDITDDNIGVLDRYTYSDAVGKPISSRATAGTGYRFVGWYDASGNQITGGMISADGLTLSYTTTRDDTYYARFERTVTQKFIRQVKNGDSWDETTDDTIATLDCYLHTDTVGKNVSSAATAKAGYRFEGWYDASGNQITGGMISADGKTLTYTTTGNATYYARFSRSPVNETYNRTLKKAGEIFQLSAIIPPEYMAGRNLTWTSSNPDIASVDDNGKVTAVANGTCTITVTAQDGSYTATCSITVEITGNADDANNDADDNTDDDSDSNQSDNIQNTESANQPNDAAKNAGTPITGDDSNLALWIALLLLATVVLVGVTVKRRKDRGPEEK